MRIVRHALAGLWIVVLAGVGCESPGNTGNMVDLGHGSDEKWTIRCLHTEGPDHVVQANLLADLLGKTDGLKASKVRTVNTSTGSTIYYGQYVKVASPETGRLVFPADYLRDLALIQRTAYNGTQVFRYAKPELQTTIAAVGLEQWDVSNAKGKRTLQIGVFYNTPTFQDRKQAAEQYVTQLRQDGFAAYFRHEPARSFVFVGDFDDSDVVKTTAGDQFGPRIENLIKQREDEFRYMLENGYSIRKQMPDGKMIVPPSALISVPRKELQP
jgi:hypothetical protein